MLEHVFLRDFPHCLLRRLLQVSKGGRGKKFALLVSLDLFLRGKFFAKMLINYYARVEIVKIPTAASLVGFFII